MVIDTDVIDLIAFNSELCVYTLIMIEERKWGDNPEQLFQIQEKVNNYLTFALDGQMLKEYPKSVNSHIKFQLNCCQKPDDESRQFINSVKEILNQYDIEFLVNVVS